MVNDVMSIVVNVDVMMAKRKMSSQELAEKIGITAANLSILKTGKAKAVRFSTLPSKPSVRPSTASRATFWSTEKINTVNCKIL